MVDLGRSNGASHYGGADAAEKSLWHKEDDVGFLPGFEAPLTLGAPIIESGLRYCTANGGSISDLFEPDTILAALHNEADRREDAGRPIEQSVNMIATAGLGDAPGRARQAHRALLARCGLLGRSCDLARWIWRHAIIADVDAAAVAIDDMVQRRKTGFFVDPFGQLATSVRIAR